MAQTTSAQQLYDLLVSRNFDPELLDAAGRPSSDPAETDVFSFDFTTESGNDYGTVVIMLNDDNDMEIYFGDNIGRGMESDDKKEWFDFLGFYFNCYDNFIGNYYYCFIASSFKLFLKSNKRKSRCDYLL